MKFKCPKCGGSYYFVMERIVDNKEAFEIQCDEANKCKWTQLVSDEEVAIFAAQRYIIYRAEKKRAKKKK